MKRIIFCLIIFFASACAAQPPAYLPGPWTSTGGAVTPMGNIAINPYYLSGDGGDEGIFIDSDGNVGIGTATPEQILHVKGAAGAYLTVESGSAYLAGMIFDDGSLRASILSGTINDLRFTTGGGEALRVLSDGNVGIGTTTPGATLDVKASTNDGSTDAQRWQDSDGVELGALNSDGDLAIVGDLTVTGEITGTSYNYGEMGNVYGSSATEAIQAADEWQAMYHANITGSAPHLNSGFSFVAGQAGVIASISDAGGGDITVADVAHGLDAGDYITINGCTDSNYNGVFEVQTAPTADTFTVTTTWGATDTGTWQEGSYLLVGGSGTYRGVWNASFGQSTNNSQTTILTPFVNATQSTKAVAARLLGNNTDVGSVGGNGLMTFSAGDRVWFAAQSTVSQTLTFTVRNVTIH